MSRPAPRPRSQAPTAPRPAPAAGPELVLDHAGPAADHAAGLLADCGLRARAVGPRRHASAALDWARCGAMPLNGAADGLPRHAPGPLATAARGAGLALGALAPALRELDAPALLGERAALSGLWRRGRISAGGSARLVSARDGFIAVNLPRPDDWRLAPAWLECAELDGAGVDWATLERLTAGRSADELVARARLMGLAVAPAPETHTPLRRWLVLGARGEPAANRSQRPLRVLDLSALWAGPLAGDLLAAAGADVLKVESPRRPDGARAGPRRFFDLMNGRKRGVALDWQDAADRAHLEALLEEADVVLESARPRALEQLGVEAASWVSARPGRIWTSITGYGRAAPRDTWVAYGDDAGAAAGLAWSPDPRVDTPCFCADAIADPLTGLHAAVATLAIARLGGGALLDLSLVDVAAHAVALPVEEEPAPIEAGPRGLSIRWRGRLEPIAPPRARRPQAGAPDLRSPRDAGATAPPFWR